MNHFFSIAFIFLGFTALGQVSLSQPTIHYVSKWSLDELQELPVGTKILFQQNCTTSVPAAVPTGIIFFEHVQHKKEKLSMAIEFKDTVVESVTYYMKSNQKNLLSAIGFPTIKARASARKGEWTFSRLDGSVFTVITGTRKTIIVIRTRQKTQ